MEKILGFLHKYKRLSKILMCAFNKINYKNSINQKGIELSVGCSLLNGIKVKSKGTNNKIIIGDYVRIKNSSISIKGSNNCVIIGDYTRLNQIEIHMEDDNNEIVIGKHTNLCGKTALAVIEGTKIKIGDNCLFSSDLHFRTGDSHSILDFKGVRINPSKDIMIGNHVWVGTKVTCLKGVVIPDNCIVAATSTLCEGDYAPNCIIGGVPGRILKRDVNWCHKRI